MRFLGDRSCLGDWSRLGDWLDVFFLVTSLAWMRFLGDWSLLMAFLGDWSCLSD
jgi:hypothetical protein